MFVNNTIVKTVEVSSPIANVQFSGLVNDDSNHPSSEDEQEDAIDALAFTGNDVNGC